MLYMTSYSIPYVEHIDSNIDNPAAEGDNSTKSSAYYVYRCAMLDLGDATTVPSGVGLDVRNGVWPVWCGCPATSV